MEKVPETDYLVQKIREGDPLWFKKIYHLYWRKLYNIAYYIVRSESEAEDIVQDVFSSLWARREQLQIKVSLENYLVKAVKYTSFFYLKLQDRRRSLVREAYLSINNAEEQIAYKELEQLIQKLLEALPPKTRQAFSLSRFEGLTYPQIAETLNISVKTVEYHISVALKKFSRELAICVLAALSRL